MRHSRILERVRRIIPVKTTLPPHLPIPRCPHRRASKEPSAGHAIPGGLLRGLGFAAAPRDGGVGGSGRRRALRARHSFALRKSVIRATLHEHRTSPAPTSTFQKIFAVTGPILQCSGSARQSVRVNPPPVALPSSRTLGLWAALSVASAAVSIGLLHAGFPAALLLGPMIAAIAFGVGGSRLHVPRFAFNAAQAMIGCLVAHASPGRSPRPCSRMGR